MKILFYLKEFAMKRLFLAYAILIALAIVSGLSACVTLGERLTPISWEIVEEAKERTRGDPELLLKELNYYLSAPLTLIMNDQNRDFRTKNGVLHIEEKNWFVLDGVANSSKIYTLSSDGIRPYLCINWIIKMRNLFP